MRHLPRATVAVALAGAAAAGAFFVFAVPADATQTGIAADELPPHAVEDFEYPQADAILAERGIELKRGDGHIVLADCSGANLVRISARDQQEYGGYVCFRVTGDEGYLSMKIPTVNGVRTNDYGNTHLELASADGQEQTFDFGPGEWQGIGESADPQQDDFALLEIRVTR